MRDPARIPVMLKRLQAVWEKHPDLRLGQLIDNVHGEFDTFYFEDEVFMECIENFYAGEPK